MFAEALGRWRSIACLPPKTAQQPGKRGQWGVCILMQEDASWAYTWDNTVCFNILRSWAFLLCMTTLGISGMSHSWVFSNYCVGRGERRPSLVFRILTYLRMSNTEKQSLVTPQSCSGWNTSNRRKKTRLFSKDLNCSTYGLKFNCVYLTFKSHAQWRKYGRKLTYNIW